MNNYFDVDAIIQPYNVTNGGLEELPYVRSLTEEGSNEVHSEVVILAPCLLLAIGAFLRCSTKSLPLPYTMQLLLLGTLLGILLRGEEWNNTLQQSIEMLGNLDPHLMLHIFLPPLIFESAASLEWHLFKKAKWHILALAGPGLLLASGLTGLVLQVLLGQSKRFEADLLSSNCTANAWSFPTSLMLGVIMSATDPVAVVSLLKDLGCKASLSTTIEGESLLNDGTALVMFTILFKLAEGEEPESVADYLLKFVEMSFGGALFGTICGVLTVQWLRLIFNDAMSEITVTLSAAYLCFFIAEYFLHVSGVLAVVCLGLYFGNTGRTAISPEVADFIEEFWICLGYIGNTLIFIIGGTVIGYKLPLFPASEYLQMFVMFVACTVIRAIVVGLVYLVFKALGTNLEYRDQILTVWGGLRGAVGLSLAMMVFGNSKNICEPVRDVVMFHTAGIIVMTVCINSTTMPYLVSFLGLDSVAPSRQRIYNQAMKNLIDAGKKQEDHIRSENIFDSCLWDEARKYYYQPKVEDPNILRRKTNSVQTEKEARRRVLMITKKSYWKQFNDGLLSHQSVQLLMHHTDNALDNSCSLNEWESEYVKLVRIGSTLEKGTDKLVASQQSSPSERRRIKVLNSLDSVCGLLIILGLIVASIILPLTLDPGSLEFRVVEQTLTVIFLTELLVRIYCLKDWQPCAVDPYIAFDFVAVLLDITLLSTEGILGDFSEFSNSIRTIRFLRLFRLLRVAGIFGRLKKVRSVALSEATTLLEKETIFKRYQRRLLHNQLKHGFEVATGFKVAREEALSAIVQLRNEENFLDFENIRHSIEEDLKNVRRALLDVQRLYIEIAASITTSVAARTVLNKQRHTIDELYQEGCLDVNEYKKLKGSVEFQQKTLTYRPPNLSMPSKIHILRQIPWLECLSEERLGNVSSSFEDAVFQRDDILVRQNEKSDSVHVLARGTVRVSVVVDSGDEIEIDVLGMGSVFGEISWALNCIRGATIKATSPGLLFTIRGEKLREIAASYEELESRLWETCGKRVSENILAQHTQESRRKVREMVHEMKIFTIDDMEKRYSFYNNGHIILLRGTAIMDDVNDSWRTITAPRILPATTKSDEPIYTVEFSTDAKFVCRPNTINIGRVRVKSWILKNHGVDLETNQSIYLDDKLPGENRRIDGSNEQSVSPIIRERERKREEGDDAV